MSGQVPGFAIQCDWNDVLRLPSQQCWLSFKIRDESSTHEHITTTVNQSNGKIKINCPESYEYISHANLSLVLKHISSGVKVAFVAPSKDFKVHTRGVLSVHQSETVMMSVSSCEGDQLLVWDIRTGEVIRNLRGHGGPIYKCRFFPSGLVVISAGADGSCRIWSAEDGINPVVLVGHKMAVTDLVIVDKGRNVVTVSRDGSAKLWDVSQSTVLADVVSERGIINCCTIATTTDLATIETEREIGTENKLLVIGSESGLVVCTHIARRQEVFQKQLQAPCNACATIEQTVVIGCHDGMIVQINLDGTILKQWHESSSPVLSIIPLPYLRFLLGRQDGTCTAISVYEPHSATRVYLTGSDCDGIRDVAFNGKWILTGCRDGVIRKYDCNNVNVHFK